MSAAGDSGGEEKSPPAEDAASVSARQLISKQRRIRGGHRASATKTLRAAQALVSSVEYSERLLPPERDGLLVCRSTLAAKMTLLPNMDEKLLDLLLGFEDEDDSREIEECDSIMMELALA